MGPPTPRVATRQGKVVFFKVREMSGNFEICQGKNELWKMSWKTDLCQGKIEFPGAHTKNLLILRRQVPIFPSSLSKCPCYCRKFGTPYNLHLKY